MTDKIINVFDVLEDDIEETGGPSASPSLEAIEGDTAAASGTAESASVTAGGDSAAGGGGEAQSWTDVSRTRRLVPKYSLSKEVMGLDNPRNKGGAPITPGSAQEAKKRGRELEFKLQILKR